MTLVYGRQEVHKVGIQPRLGKDRATHNPLAIAPLGLRGLSIVISPGTFFLPFRDVPHA